MFNQRVGVIVISIILISGVLLTSNFNNAVAYSKDSWFLKRICKVYYTIFLEIGEEQFREKFWYKRYLQQCVDMYTDDGKHFRGKGKLLALYGK